MNKKLAKNITVTGSLFWIFAGVWGVTLCFEAAKELRNQQVQAIELGQLQNNWQNNYGVAAIQAASWSVSPPKAIVFRELELSGLSRNPYVFHKTLTQSLLISVLCILVSFFVLYAALVVDGQRQPSWLEDDDQTQVSYNL